MADFVTTPDFLRALYRDCDGLIEFRALPKVRRGFFALNDLHGMKGFLRSHARTNLYHAVATRRDASSGELANAQHLPAVYSDLDIRNTKHPKAPTEAEARETLDRCPLPPSVVVASGGGFYPFWLLREPLDLQDPGDCATAYDALRRLTAHLGADPACAEPARVLRLPNSQNYKYEPAPVVTIESFHPDRRYNLSEITDWLPAWRNDPKAETHADSDGEIGEGGRNAYLMKLAGAMRRKGCSVEAIEAALLIANQQKCRPSLSADEVRAVAGSAGRYTPAADAALALHDFHAYMPLHSYIFTPSRELWPASSVNGRLPGVPITDHAGKTIIVKPATWLDTHRAVEQMTWCPGEPMLIEDRLVSEGGWIHRAGCRTFNLYRAPTPVQGDPAQAAPWLEHVSRIYPEDAPHLVRWLAHRVQRPAEKINHALVLGGYQGIGKDTLLEPVKHAVGPWNVAEIAPTHLLGRFNGFVKSVILRISEARDLGDVDRYSFYDHLKSYTAAPPDVLRCDEKFLRETSVWNVCGVVITTNHKSDGLYLPADDRRHYVAWSDATKETFPDAYWRGLWQWYGTGGSGHVAAYLAALDLSDFDAKAPPPKTAAFWDIVDAHRASEDAELADVLDTIGNPDAITLGDLIDRAPATLAEWLRDRKVRRQIPHRLEAAGYVPVRNPTAKDGLWKPEGRRQVIYANTTLPLRDRLTAVMERCR